MAAYAPQGVSSIIDQPYRDGDKDARLDVYFPMEADQPGMRLPTVIWTHGGAWISGHKDDAAPYFQLIAIEGYAVISLDYSLAPDETYPTPIHQVNDALAYVQQNADRFHVDVDRIVLAGDSAGAQITSQVATLVTNPAYAAELGLTPSLQPAQLRGVILHCGIYDMVAFKEGGELPGDTLATRVLGWGIRTVLWAYTDSRDPDDTLLRQMSSINHVTSDFPPTFISGGNGDPLTDDHSRPLATKLQGLGVEVTTLFYSPDHEPSLGHEYQFNLDDADAQNALTQTLAFLQQHTGS
jgi:acetyl esterase/lipase